MPADPRNEHVILLEGDVTLERIADLEKRFSSLLASGPHGELVVDGSGMTRLDSAGAAFLDALPGLAAAQNKSLRVQNVPDRLKSFWDFVHLEEPEAAPRVQRQGLLERVGAAAQRETKSLAQLLRLIADIAYWSVADLFDRSHIRKGAFVDQAIQIGYEALPIIGLVLFLVGFIVSLMSAVQLRQFGGNLFVADMLAVGLTSEMGPLMTAVLVAGRSGSAIAAEVATMKSTEEWDALRSMALNPLRFVVVPKIWAMTLAMPLLTSVADLIGMLGGFAIATTYLQLAPAVFVQRVMQVLLLKYIVTGLIKSVSFGWVIAITGVARGLGFSGGSEGIGRATTSSVVTALFMIILVDSFWVIVFNFILKI